MTLNVGPRLQEHMQADPAAKLVCPICLIYVAEGADFEVKDLGNPESGYEGETKQ